MNVVGSLIRVDSFQVHHMSNNVIFVGNTISTKHITAMACNVKGFATGVALHKRDHLRSDALLLDKAADAKARLKTKRDLGMTICKFHLYELISSEGRTKLLAVEGVLPCSVYAELSC